MIPRALCVVALVALSVACARRVAPLDVRTVSRVVDVPSIDKDTAYDRAVVWFDNTHDRTSIRVSRRDPATSLIVGSGEMQCNASIGAGLRGMGLGRNQSYLRFVVEFQARDGRYRLVFSELFYYLVDLQFPGSNLAQGPANQTEVDALYRECLQSLEANLSRSINGAPADF